MTHPNVSDKKPSYRKWRTRELIPKYTLKKCIDKWGHYSYREISKPEKPKKKEMTKIVKENIRKPAKNHPWREPGARW